MSRLFDIGAIILACLLAVPVAARGNQDTLARAKDYYASASYDEALQVLVELRTKPSSMATTEVAAYQMLCLVALGRNQEATDAIEAIVRQDPLYHPSEVDASPRVRSFFEGVRRPLLPTVVRQMYARAKASLDRKETAQAAAEFDRVLALLDEIGTTGNENTADLRTLAQGFRDLSRAASAPPPAPEPVLDLSRLEAVPVAAAAADRPVGAAPPAPVPDLRIYGAGDAGVTAPVAVTRSMPTWHPVNAIDKIRNFRGSIELVIDERGKVQSVVIVQGVHADYDPALARAAGTWSFKPAMKNDVAVKYRLSMDILLTPPASR